MEIVSDLAFEFCYCVWISVNQTLKIMGTWCSDTMNFGGSFKGSCTVTTHNNQGIWYSDTVVVYSGSLKRPGIIKPHKIWAPVAMIMKFFSWGFKGMRAIINRNIWNQYVFWVWVECLIFLYAVRMFIFYKQYCSRMCLCS